MAAWWSEKLPGGCLTERLGKSWLHASIHQRRDLMQAETKSGKYLTFQLADEDYGIALLQIKEIIGMMPITATPRRASSSSRS